MHLTFEIYATIFVILNITPCRVLVVLDTFCKTIKLTEHVRLKTLDKTRRKQPGSSRSLLHSFVPSVFSLLVNVNYVVNLQLQLILAVWRVWRDASESFMDRLRFCLRSRTRIQRVRLPMMVNVRARTGASHWLVFRSPTI